MHKIYLSANELLQNSYQMAANIIADGFRPDFIVALWRGGTPVGIAVQELMEYAGIKTDHIAIRTSSYTDIDQPSKKVRVHNLSYLIKNIDAEQRLLIVDDVFDTGNSVKAVLQTIQAKARRNTPAAIRVATPYFKPDKNQTDIQPDYYISKTDAWIVFPHELCGLQESEIIHNKPFLKPIFAQIEQTRLLHPKKAPLKTYG